MRIYLIMNKWFLCTHLWNCRNITNMLVQFKHIETAQVDTTKVFVLIIDTFLWFAILITFSLETNSIQFSQICCLVCFGRNVTINSFCKQDVLWHKHDKKEFIKHLVLCFLKQPITLFKNFFKIHKINCFKKTLRSCPN